MWHTLLEHCSEDRLNKYLEKVAKDQLAAEFMYVANQQVSESLYPLIAILEVSLRNRVHSKLHQKFSRADWWDDDQLNIQEFKGCTEKLERARSKLFHRISTITKKNQVKAGQLVAEVSLNFWNELFSEPLSKVLWKDLLDCFPNIPEDARKRRKVASPLANITRLRNRVMHHEPILFDQTVLPDMLHARGTQLIQWMSADMAAWLAKRDRFKTVWMEYQLVKTSMDAWLASHAELKAARDSGAVGGALRPFYQKRDADKSAFDELASEYLGNASPHA